MPHRGKLLIFFGSALIALYGISAAFYGKVVAKDEAYKELAVFMEVLDKIDDDYVEAPDMNRVQEGAMRGLIEALDPYCSFLSKQQYETLQKNEQEGAAIAGMVLSKRPEVVYVVSCERDGAAAEAGIRPGDYLVAINDVGVQDKSILEVNYLLSGSIGTKVKITIFRSSETEPLHIELPLKPRATVPIVSKMLDDEVGILGVSSLANTAIEQVRIKLKTLISAGADKLILDLRDCADGNPADGADLANFFLKDGIIYYSQNRQGEKVKIIEASPAEFLTDVPMVVLINNSTAGAAEIVAGSLKDHERAVIVGEKSFGLGSEQKTIKLKNDAILILSIAKIFTPGGKVIQDASIREAGIQPDFLVPDDNQRRSLMVESYYDDQDDVNKYRRLKEKIDNIQLEKALEVLAKEPMPARKAA